MVDKCMGTKDSERWPERQLPSEHTGGLVGGAKVPGKSRQLLPSKLFPRAGTDLRLPLSRPRPKPSRPGRRHCGKHHPDPCPPGGAAGHVWAADLQEAGEEM